VGETGPLAKTVALRLLEHLLTGAAELPPPAISSPEDLVPF
jgi:hypothetical protein